MSEVVVVTGASRGIGAAIARRFAARGALVWNLARTAGGIEGVRDVTADLAQPGFAAELPDELSDTVARSDRTVLVHNAFTMVNDTADAVDRDGLRRMLEVGVHAAAALNDELLSRLPRGSAVVYLGSTLSEKAVAGSFSYVVAKHAVVGMMRATCQDLLDRGVHTVCVCPGVTDTEMLRAHVGDQPDVLAALREMTAGARLVEPAEIARVVVMAADNAVLNGAVIHANLGQRER